ncbi:MAG: sulfurtransferase [Proteobacteria bacterium]|nr:sulfurtransferase [Pseudomonadota bacterium]
MSVVERRAEAVAGTVDRVRAIEQSMGATRAALEKIEAELIALATRTELFPAEHFPVAPGAKGNIYRLSEDSDYRFALYASAGVPGKSQPPHNHTTWAVIAGIYGDEHNVFYQRTDDRSTPGRGALRKSGEKTVTRGGGCALLPDGFHTIEVTGDGPSLHLHIYGRSLEHLPERIFFAGEDGGAYQVFPPNPNIGASVVGARELKAMLGDGRELALLDVREEGVFARRHPLFACSLPLSRLELAIDARVPRRATRIVLCDDDDGLAQRAAAKLGHFGYGCVSVLAGGVEAWEAAGYEVFGGVNVPSKAFGEFVAHHAGTPHIDAAEVKAKLDAGEDMVIIDARPMSEYRAMNIPGAVNCPGAELVLRISDIVATPDTLVVVNCAGRTRSIIGAQSLIDAGIANPVAALENGTMGWHLAGFELERGQHRPAPEPTPRGLAIAKAAAARVAGRHGVRTIDRAALAGFEAESDRRSLYLLDVRGPEEFEAGHLPGSRSAPGGQLVQATDAYVGTRNARLVLVDDDGVRAPMTASWLIQMGWDEVYVLAGAWASGESVAGPAPATVPGLDEAAPETITAAALEAALDRGEAVVLDLDTSPRYREGHIPGAWFAVRSRLAAALAKAPGAAMLVLTSPDGVLARLCAPEAARLTEMPVRVLAGGTGAWRAAGLSIATGEEHMADVADDVWRRPYDRAAGAEDAMTDYLRWELDLPDQVERDGDARFRTFKNEANKGDSPPLMSPL